jgi:hypothetical protein
MQYSSWLTAKMSACPLRSSIKLMAGEQEEAFPAEVLFQG